MPVQKEMESRMKLGFFHRLKPYLGLFFRRQRQAQPYPGQQGTVSRDDERDRSAHEYELYYWSSAPGPWY